MKCFAFIGLLSGLDNNVQKGLTDHVNETVQMHVVIPFVVNKARFIIVLNNFRIGSVNNMTSITCKDAVIFKLVGSPWKGRREFREQILSLVLPLPIPMIMRMVS